MKKYILIVLMNIIMLIYSNALSEVYPIHIDSHSMLEPRPDLKFTIFDFFHPANYETKASQPIILTLNLQNWTTTPINANEIVCIKALYDNYTFEGSMVDDDVVIDVLEEEHFSVVITIPNSVFYDPNRFSRLSFLIDIDGSVYTVSTDQMRDESHFRTYPDRANQSFDSLFQYTNERHKIWIKEISMKGFPKGEKGIFKLACYYQNLSNENQCLADIMSVNLHYREKYTFSLNLIDYCHVHVFSPLQQENLDNKYMIISPLEEFICNWELNIPMAILSEKSNDSLVLEIIIDNQQHYIDLNEVMKPVGNHLFDYSFDCELKDAIFPLVRKLDNQYYELGKMNIPKGYSLERYETQISYDINETAVSFESMYDSIPIKTIYVSGVAKRTASEMLDVVINASLYEEQSERKEAYISGHDVHYFYSKALVSTEIPDEFVATITAYVNTVENSCILVTLSSPKGEWDDLPSEEEMMDDSHLIFECLKLPEEVAFMI